MVKSLPALWEMGVLIPRLGRPPGEGNGYPLQYSCLGNSMDRGDWWATVLGFMEGPKKLLFTWILSGNIYCIGYMSIISQF